MDSEVPPVLGLLSAELHDAECVVWLSHPDGLQRTYSAGLDGEPYMSAASVQELADSADSPRDDFALAQLTTGERTLGVLTVRTARRISDSDRLFVSTVADLLTPVLRAAEQTRRLESEVAERTREVEAQRRFTAQIVDSLPVGLYVIDRDYRIQAWNRKRETGMQGVSRDEALGRTIFEILHRQPAELLRREFDEVFRSGGIQQFQTESDATGQVRTFRISKIPMRMTGDGVTHVITIGEDITEWREAQERFAQAEKLAAIGTLAAGVMHEINNPLATIGACAEAFAFRLQAGAVSAEEFGDELRDALKMIEHEVHRCKAIVEGLLDFSRPKASTKTLVDLNTAIDKTLFLLKHHSRFKRLTVHTELDKALPLVLGNEEQLIQVVMSLLLNAMDAMEGDGTVTLRTRTDTARSAVMAEVLDEGQGIRRTDMPKLFEPFFTTKPPGRGTGLGLSICYAIIGEHGGRIEVDSVQGSGSAFRIVLPPQVVT